MLVAGVDIGNSTTEICLLKKESNQNRLVATAMASTTGLKGSLTNAVGIKEALQTALIKVGLSLNDLDRIRLNAAAPVVGDTAMETISTTLISDATMIGHDPSTPAGLGLALGMTVPLTEIHKQKEGLPLLALVDASYSYEEAVIILNTSKARVVGVVLQKDEAVLVYNRLNNKVPIIDEVKRMDRLPPYTFGAIEVADVGQAITTLSNPYGLAKVFDLSARETNHMIPIAKSLIGKRSAIVLKTNSGSVKEMILEAGSLTFHKGDQHQKVSIDQGGRAIMAKVEAIGPYDHVTGQAGTQVGVMFERMKASLSNLVEDSHESVRVQDILAMDTLVPVKVQGGLADEVAMEKAVAIAAMVKAETLPMSRLADLLSEELKVPVEVAGVEAVMAMIGAMTTKGTSLPLALLDLGGGSTDAALLLEDGTIRTTHLAGAGNFVTMLINEGLALNNTAMAENIKKYPLGEVLSLYQIRHENGDTTFFKEPLDPRLYAKVVVKTEKGYEAIATGHTMEKIRTLRRLVKHEVFVTNALRALKEVAEAANLKSLPNVVMVGGSALDFEIPMMIQEALAMDKVIAGRADIQGHLGPRNAVATGLCLSY